MNWRYIRLLASAITLGMGGLASAATYTLPADLGTSPFASCSFSSGITYNCTTSISLPTGSIVLLTQSIILNINPGGFRTQGNAQINNNNSGYTLLIKTTEDIDLAANLQGAVSFEAPGKTINLQGNVNITGNLTASAINIGNSSTVNGVCTPSNPRCTGGVAPTIATQAATSVGTDSATLNGTVSSNGATTTVSFGYSTTSGSFTSTCTPGTSSFGGTASGQAFSCSLTGLTCGTTYYFRASGINSAGTTNGGQLSFSTSACPAGFGAYESNISNTSAATPANRVINTRVASTSGSLCPNGVSSTATTLPSAAKTCSLTVAAFTAAGAVLTTYSGTVSVNLQYCGNVSRTGSGTGSTVSCGGSWSDLSAAQGVTLSSGVGVATFASVSNAYEIVRVKIASTTVGGSPWYAGDYFAIRPTGLTVTATDATVSTAGSTRSLTSGANTHKAGQPFTLNAQAYVGTAATTASNYRGTGAGPVSQTVNTTSPTGTGVVNGTLTPGTWSGTGTVISSTATYSEVGTFTLTLEDQDYANVDVSDGSTTAERYISGSASLGRFTPDHFLTTVTQGCGTFSYSGQPFTVAVTAYNGLSTPTATRNYGLTTNTVTLSNAGDASRMTGNTVASSSFGMSDGVATTTTPVYTFASRTTAPTGITVRATDLDSITSTGYETAAGTTIVSGRLNLLNAYGSEKLPLSPALKVEYYDTTGSAGWRQASSPSSYADSCTRLTAANFGFTTSAPSCATAVPSCITQLSLTATASAGAYIRPWGVQLSRPSGAGSMCMTVSLDGTAPGKQCTAAVSGGIPAAPGGVATSANAAWLMYPWTSSTASNPFARVDFGVYRSPLIYRRENY